MKMKMVLFFLAVLPCNTHRLHFTEEGYSQFGKRYAEKMLPNLG